MQDDHANALRKETLRFLYQALPLPLITSVALSTIAVGVLWEHAPHAALLAWGATQLALGTLRTWLHQRHRHVDDADPAQTLKRYRVFLGTALLAGMAWAAGSLLLLSLEGAHATFLCFTIAGVCSGSVVSLGVDKLAARFFIVPIVATLATVLLFQAGQLGLVMSVMTLLYGTVLWGNASRAHQQFAESFQLRREADLSAAQLRVLSDRMEIAAQSLGIGVWDLDLKTDTYVLSDRIYEIYGSPRGSFADVPTELLRRIHPDDRKDVLRKHFAAIASASRFDSQFRIVRSDGEERVVRSTALVIVDDNGKPVRMTGVNWDITELKRAERMKSEFVSTVSHELRTPLTSIGGSLGLLAGGAAGALPEAAVKLLDVAHRNCNRLTLLINDLLDMEKIDAGKLRFDLEAQLLMPLVEQSIEANAGYAMAHGVSLELTGSAPGACAHIDAHRFLQVMANLLSNAAKFSPRGASVEIAAATRENMIRIEIRDRGPGIPEAFRACIFQKFSQADSTDTRAKSGTGLGLAISKALVEGMGGTMGFETAPGAGTTFYFELPQSLEHERCGNG